VNKILLFIDEYIYLEIYMKKNFLFTIEINLKHFKRNFMDKICKFSVTTN